MGLLAQVVSVGLGLAQAHQRDIGWLIVRRVFTSGFAQRSRVGGDIQNIVHHLKRQTERRTIGRERRQRWRIRLTAGRPHQHTALQQRASFEAVHLAQLRLVQRLPNAGQINRLAASHASRASRMRQQATQARLYQC